MPISSVCRIVLAGLGVGTLVGCTAPAPDGGVALCGQLGATTQQRAELYFGRSRPDGTLVAETDWQDFLARTATPLFPDGLTIVAGDGQWREPADGKIIREPARIMVVVAPASPTLADRLQTLRDAYRLRFQQSAVGIVVTSGCAAF